MTSLVGKLVDPGLEVKSRRVVVSKTELHPLSDAPDPRAKSERITARGLRETIRQCVRGEADWPLLLYGAPGTGKTKACECLVAMSGGWMTKLSTLCRQLNEADRGELWRTLNGVGWKVSRTEMWHDLRTCRLLVIDEIGLREASAHVYETLKDLLDWRVDREPLPTILISNVTPDKLQGVYDHRIVSRATCGTNLEVVGPDLRIG